MFNNTKTIKFCALAMAIALGGGVYASPVNAISTESTEDTIEVPLSDEGAYVDSARYYAPVIAEVDTTDDTAINPLDMASSADSEYGRGDIATGTTTTPTTTTPSSSSTSTGTSSTTSGSSTSTTTPSSSSSSSTSSSSLPDTSVGTTTASTSTVGTPDTGIFSSPAARSATIGTSAFVFIAGILIVVAAKRKFSRQTRAIRKF